jgi:AsmA protein
MGGALPGNWTECPGMRHLRILVIVVAALIALAVAAAVAVLLSVDPNSYRGQIERLTEQKTGRRLQIGGDLRLKLFPYLALSIDDVQLGNPPGYGQSAFLSVRRASVGVRLLPILRKRLQVSRIVLDGLTADLVSRSASSNNWKDLAQPKDSAGQEAGGSSQTRAPLSIAGLEITNASLRYRDQAKNTITTLSNLRLRTGAIGTGQPVDLALDFDYGNGGTKPAAHLSMAAIAQWPDSSPNLDLRDLEVHGTWFGRGSEADGIGFSVRSPSVQLDTQAQTLSPAIFTVQAGDVTGKLSARANKLFTDRIVTGTLTVPRLPARKALASLGETLPKTRDPNALSAFSLACQYTLTPKQLRLTDLSLVLDDTQVRGSIAVDDLDTMALGYALNVDRIDADRYLPPRNPPAASGQVGASAPPSSIPVQTLRKLDVHGTLEVGQATFDGLALTAISLPLAAKNGQIRLGPTQARLLGGTYKGDIVLDAAPSQARVSLNEHLKGADIGTLMKVAFDTTRLSGRGDADLVAAGTGNTYAAILGSLDGKIDFNVKEGAFNGIDLSYEVQSAQALLQQQPLPARSGAARTVFNTFSGSATLEKGVLRNEDLSIETDYLETHGKGTLDIGTRAIDYRLVTSVYKRPPPGQRGANGGTKAADIPLRLTGNLGNLKIRPDLEALAAARLRQEVDKRLKPLMGQPDTGRPDMGRGKGDALKQLGDKLKDLLRH